MKNKFSPFKKTSKSTRLYIAIPLVFLAIYAAFLIGRSVWQQYQVNRQIDSLSGEIADLNDRTARLKEAIKYYRSTSFKEKEARSKLGYIKAGETAIALPPEKVEASKENQGEDVFGLSQETTFAQPNYIRWWNFFFKGE